MWGRLHADLEFAPVPYLMSESVHPEFSSLARAIDQEERLCKGEGGNFVWEDGKEEERMLLLLIPQTLEVGNVSTAGIKTENAIKMTIRCFKLTVRPVSLVTRYSWGREASSFRTRSSDGYPSFLPVRRQKVIVIPIGPTPILSSHRDRIRMNEGKASGILSV